MTPEQEFSELLAQATYHYADDSGKEWGKARECMNKAADIAIAQGWDLEAMHKANTNESLLAGVGDVEAIIERRKANG